MPHRTLHFLLLGFAAAVLSHMSARSETTRPNILILYADDMGYGDLGAQNPGSKIPTPNLDKLAAEGMRFTDAHSSSGICTPSRYALLTGRFHWRKFHSIVDAFGPPVFGPDELTLPKMLKQKGYRTACIGKWHLGWNWDDIRRPEAKAQPKVGYASSDFDWSKPISGGPLSQGFDSYFGDDVPNFPPYTWFENDRVAKVPDMPLKLDIKTAEGEWEARPGPMVSGWDFYAVMPTLTARAVEFVKQQKGAEQPFFLFFPWTSPHAPIVPAKEFQGKTKAGGFGDYMHQSDFHAGQVLKALEESGLKENTIVIFTADNGPEHYAYDRIKNFDHRSTAELRGLKRDIWEGGHRVPFVVRWPGVIKPATVSKALTSQVDLMGTIAAIVGFDLPATAADDSHNQLPVWRGENTAGPRTAIVHNTKKDHYAVRQGDWLLVDAPSGAVTKVPNWFDPANNHEANPYAGELYNLADDVGQHHNLYGEKPGKVAELKALLTEIRKSGQVRPGPSAKGSP